MIATPDYTNTNFSGLNLAGFAPVSGGIILLGGGPYFTRGTLTNANFTNATNLSVNTLAQAASLNGVILTGTGITRSQLESALLATGRSNSTVTSILNTITFGP